jgi:hypothetical protein
LPGALVPPAGVWPAGPHALNTSAQHARIDSKGAFMGMRLRELDARNRGGRLVKNYLEF